MRYTTAALILICLSVYGQDKVYLKSGDIFEGEIRDPGRNYIEVKMPYGTARVRKRDIVRVEFGRSRIEEVVDTDRLILRDGRVVMGEVSDSPDGRSYVVRFSEGGSAIYPKSEVMKVVPKGQIFGERPGAGPEEIRALVKKLVSKLSLGGMSASKAQKELKNLGIFAIDFLKEELKTAKGEAARRIRSVLASYELRKRVGDTLDEKLPEIYEGLEDPRPGNRIQALEAALTLEPKEAVDLILFKLEDPEETDEVRAFCVEILRRLNRYRDLVASYKRAEGALGLAIAMALAQNGVYIGLPALISALTEKNKGLRILVGERLKAYTGKDYLPDPNAPLDQWEKAAQKYMFWWRVNEEKIVSQTQALIAREPSKTPQRARALQKWRRGADFWGQGKTLLAEKAFRDALTEDPSFARAALSLGILLYRDLKKPAEAASILKNVVLGRYPDADDRTLAWGAYHLGMLNRERSRFKEAVEWLDRAVRLRKNYVEGFMALGETFFRWAITGENLSADERKRLLRNAEKSFRDARTALLDYEENLLVLPADGAPVGPQVVPFKRHQYLQSLQTLRELLTRIKSTCSMDLVRVYIAQGDMTSAEKEARRAVKEDPENASLQLLLALVFEKQGKYQAALRQYRRVLRLDPENETARKGEKRLAVAAKRSG